MPTAHGPGLKTLNDLEPLWHEPAESMLSRSGIGLSLERTWDIATLAIDAGYRSAAATGLVALGLYQSIVRTGEALGVEWMVAILDRAVFRMSKARFHQPFFALAEGRPYLGSRDSLPIYGCVSDSAPPARDRGPGDPRDHLRRRRHRTGAAPPRPRRVDDPRADDLFRARAQAEGRREVHPSADSWFAGRRTGTAGCRCSAAA